MDLLSISGSMMQYEKLTLSIIVPFYNVETYIEDCIRSLYKQDIPMDEYEVIAVDDCSPDNSRLLVERLQKEYPNLHLEVLPKNRKLGGARNAGLDVAKGKYVLFVDSDDYLLPNVLRALLEQMEKDDLDFLEFDYVLDNNGKITKTVELPDTGVCSGNDLFFNEHFIWWRDHVVAWRKLYNRYFLKNNALCFIENIMHEDNDFAMRAFSLANNVRHVAVDCYVYRNNPESFIRQSLSLFKLQCKLQSALRVAELRPFLVRSHARFAEVVDGFVSYSLKAIAADGKKFGRAYRKVINLSSDQWIYVRKCLSLKNYMKFRYGTYIKSFFVR